MTGVCEQPVGDVDHRGGALVGGDLPPLVRRHGPAEGYERIRGTIQRYATALGAPGKYHETVTRAWSAHVYRALTETVTTGDPEQAQPLPAASVDPAAVAAQRQAERTRHRALWLALGGALVAAVALLCAIVVPRGARRHWRPAA